MLLVVAKTNIPTCEHVDHKLNVFSSKRGAPAPLMSYAAGPRVDDADPEKLPFVEDELDGKTQPPLLGLREVRAAVPEKLQAAAERPLRR